MDFMAYALTGPGLSKGHLIDGGDGEEYCGDERVINIPCCLLEIDMHSHLGLE